MSLETITIAQLVGLGIGSLSLAVIASGLYMVAEWLWRFDRRDPAQVQQLTHTVIMLSVMVGLILYASAT